MQWLENILEIILARVEPLELGLLIVFPVIGLIKACLLALKDPSYPPGRGSKKKGEGNGNVCVMQATETEKKPD